MYYEINKDIANSINGKPFNFGLYWSFMVIENNGKYYISKQELDNIQIPDDFNEDNPYDPDGLYPDDPNIKKKLKRIERRVDQMFLEIIENWFFVS